LVLLASLTKNVVLQKIQDRQVDASIVQRLEYGIGIFRRIYIEAVYLYLISEVICVY
jgi:hypothetical protein